MLRTMRSLALAAALAATPALAHSPNQPPHQLHKIGDLQLESGETIKDFAISYVTHGKLNEKKSNVILMVTAISGNHHRLDFLIGPGKALDTDKYFIICTDAIGNGLTTSPSNSAAQPRMKFPKFLIRDMVTSQRKLMEHLGIGHVVAVIGPSMGGMQVLQWGVSYPDFMDSLVSLVPLAKTPAWTVTVLEATRKAIMLDPAWKNGDYTTQPRAFRTANAFFGIATNGGTLAYQKLAPSREKADKLLNERLAAPFNADANDFLYQWDSSRDYDASPGLEKIQAALLAINAADDERNPPETGLMTQALKRVKNGKLYLIPASEDTRGHGTTGMAKFWKAQLQQFMDATARKTANTANTAKGD